MPTAGCAYAIFLKLAANIVSVIDEVLKLFDIYKLFGRLLILKVPSLIQYDNKCGILRRRSVSGSAPILLLIPLAQMI